MMEMLEAEQSPSLGSGIPSHNGLSHNGQYNWRYFHCFADEDSMKWAKRRFLRSPNILKDGAPQRVQHQM